MEAYDVYMTEPADNDLRDIVRYISSQLNAPVTALNMLKTIRAAVASLETMAHVYPLVRDDRLALLGYWLLVIKITLHSILLMKQKRLLTSNVYCSGVATG